MMSTEVTLTPAYPPIDPERNHRSLAWLKANYINPFDVVANTPAVLNDDETTITVTVFERDAEGKRRYHRTKVDDDRENDILMPLHAKHTVPLVAHPNTFNLI